MAKVEVKPVDQDGWQGIISFDVQLGLQATSGPRGSGLPEEQGRRLAEAIKRRLDEEPYAPGSSIGDVTMTGHREEGWILMDRYPWDEPDRPPDVAAADVVATAHARESLSDDLLQLMAAIDNLRRAFPQEPSFERILEDLERAKDALMVPDQPWARS